MICIHLKGGLGNQMFQYAAGRALADHISSDLFIDLSTYQFDKIRKYELSDFNIRADIATSKVLAKWPDNQKKIFKILQKLGLPSKWHFEINFGYEKKWFSLKTPIMLDGFYQSEKYFIDYRNNILNDFELSVPLDYRTNNIKSEISKQESVMVHVRRGDYVSNSKNLDIHGICTIDYYQKAYELILKKINNPKFFIFSDDLQWCREHLHFFKNAFYVDNHNSKASFDIYLMSLCDNYVIANSSFSWWGAWLNNKQKKVVIAPKEWFVTDALNSKDICPSSWTLI